jgi:hypothetical protein
MKLSHKKLSPNQIMAALENVYNAEINNLPPFKAKAPFYKDLVADGLLSETEGGGYELTRAGRLLYCRS